MPTNYNGYGPMGIAQGFENVMSPYLPPPPSNYPPAPRTGPAGPQRPTVQARSAANALATQRGAQYFQTQGYYTPPANTPNLRARPSTLSGQSGPIGTSRPGGFPMPSSSGGSNSINMPVSLWNQWAQNRDPSCIGMTVNGTTYMNRPAPYTAAELHARQSMVGDPAGRQQQRELEAARRQQQLAQANAPTAAQLAQQQQEWEQQQREAEWAHEQAMLDAQMGFFGGMQDSYNTQMDRYYTNEEKRQQQEAERQQAIMGYMNNMYNNNVQQQYGQQQYANQRNKWAMDAFGSIYQNDLAAQRAQQSEMDKTYNEALNTVRAGMGESGRPSESYRMLQALANRDMYSQGDIGNLRAAMQSNTNRGINQANNAAVRQYGSRAPVNANMLERARLLAEGNRNISIDTHAANEQARLARTQAFATADQDMMDRQGMERDRLLAVLGSRQYSPLQDNSQLYYGLGGIMNQPLPQQQPIDPNMFAMMTGGGYQPLPMPQMQLPMPPFMTGGAA